MKKAISLLLGAVLLLTGCGSWAPNGETRIQSDIAVLEYNDLRDNYMERPTFVSLRQRIGAEPALQIEVDQYGVEDGQLYFTPQSAQPLIDQIDKYLEWEAIALERGDQIDRKIGEAPSISGFKYVTSFFSGNAKSHYFVLGQCIMGCLTGIDQKYRFYFDHENAVRLQGLLTQFRDGKVQALNEDEVYK